MKILMFSADPTILDDGSAAGKRMIEYGRRVRKLDILVLTPHLAVRPPSVVRLAESVNSYALTGRFSRFLGAFFKARQMLKKEKYDLLVAQDIEHSFICWTLSKSFKVKWQMQIHTDIFSPYFARHSFFNRIRVVLAKFLIPRASCTRVVSERIKDSIIQRFSNLENKITILPILGILTSSDIKPERFPEFEKTILMVSRLAPEKNIGLAIEAMDEVVKKHPKTGLVIIGDGPEWKNLESKIRNLGRTKNIKMVGRKDSKSVASYLKGSDIFLSTSWYEGWGMSVVDAARYGAAVIMTDVGLAGELVENNKTALIVPVGDKDALVGAILRLLENDGLRRSLIEEVAKEVQELLYSEIYYQKIVDSWKKCRTSNVQHEKPLF